MSSKAKLAFVKKPSTKPVDDHPASEFEQVTELDEGTGADWLKLVRE